MVAAAARLEAASHPAALKRTADFFWRRTGQVPEGLDTLPAPWLAGLPGSRRPIQRGYRIPFASRQAFLRQSPERRNASAQPVPAAQTEEGAGRGRQGPGSGPDSVPPGTGAVVDRPLAAPPSGAPDGWFLLVTGQASHSPAGRQSCILCRHPLLIPAGHKTQKRGPLRESGEVLAMPEIILGFEIDDRAVPGRIRQDPENDERDPEPVRP